MKWLFYVIVFIYMAYRAVYGAKFLNEISIEKINYGNDTVLRTGTRKAINCRASNRNQKLEWVDPLGKVIKRVPTSRVFTQEHFVTNPNGGRAPALVLIFSDLMVKDSGIYQCRSGTNVQEVSLCIMKPAEFVDTPTEVSADMGRAITLTCQAKGDPEPNLSWWRDNMEISESSDQSKFRVNTKYNSQGFESLLTIVSLEPGDSGEYSCFAFQDSRPFQKCENAATMNITLQVNHAPIFETENNTKAVYGRTNEIVDLVCSASGYPAPTYRWFKAVGDDVLAEFDKNQIKYSVEENKAILSVTASPTTFGQKYKCLATNSYGETEKYFKLLTIKMPEQPSEVKFIYATDELLEFKVYFDDIYFPVNGFQIQYVKSKRKPSDWRRADELYDLVEIDDPEFVGFPVIIRKLEEDTTYWVRVKAVNDEGESSWSEPVIGVTDVKSEDVVEETEEETDDKPVAAEVTSDATFYGIFFAGGIAVVAVVCMFVMRLV